MKCPSCGVEIPEGKLLCEACGEEIQIVPDFEPELEDRLTESLSDVIEELTETFGPVEKIPDMNGEDVNEERLEEEYIPRSSRKFTIITICLAICLAMMGVAGYMSYRHYQNSRAYKEKLYKEAFEQKNYDLALVYLAEAKEKGANEEANAFAMVDCYDAMGRDGQYLETLWRIISLPSVTKEGKNLAYSKIIAYYDERQDYEQINAILQGSNDAELRESYSEYLATPPSFNYTEGSYNEVIPLKILGNTGGHLYFTINGGDPTDTSEEYISPVFLDAGDYTVKAIYVNEYGIASTMATAQYHVEIPIPYAPEVDVYSGDYNTPQLIHVESEEGCRIFYTTDGSEPDLDATEFKDFLTVPLGKSTVKFVAVNSAGVLSEVTVRNYNLDLDTKYSTADGMQTIYNYLLSQGKAIDDHGLVSAEEMRSLSYNFALVTTMGEEEDYYIYSEYIKYADGQTERTGGYYAVNIYDLSLYTTSYDVNTCNFALTSDCLSQP